MLLDTCFCIDLIRERKKGISGPAIEKLKSLETAELFISMFTLCELRAGAELSVKAKAELERVEKMLEFIAVLYPDSSFPVFYGEAEAAPAKERYSYPRYGFTHWNYCKSGGNNNPHERYRPFQIDLRSGG